MQGSDRSSASDQVPVKSSNVLPTLIYTRFGLEDHQLAQCAPLNMVENDGAKFAGIALSVEYVVPDSFPITSTPFIQNITSFPFWKCMRLSLVMFAPVTIDVVVPVDVIVYSLCVASVLCRTTILSFVGLDRIYAPIPFG